MEKVINTSSSLGIRNSLALGQGVGPHREIERHADELLNARPTTVLTPRFAQLFTTYNDSHLQLMISVPQSSFTSKNLCLVLFQNHKVDVKWWAKIWISKVQVSHHGPLRSIVWLWDPLAVYWFPFSLRTFQISHSFFEWLSVKIAYKSSLVFVSLLFKKYRVCSSLLTYVFKRKHNDIVDLGIVYRVIYTKQRGLLVLFLLQPK